ncbi:hypothetical protein KCU64_g5252, partial [Aureobasidium melanogenum]
MMNTTVPSFSEPRSILFIGTNLRHAVTNRIQDEVARSLGLPWKLTAIDDPCLDEFDRLSKESSFVGAVVTIPHKINIMSHVNGIDPVGTILGACNCIYRGHRGQLTGTNTDWIGVRDALIHATRETAHCDQAAADGTRHNQEPRSGMVVGSGGAARAAVYALSQELGCSRILIINRDVDEVESLKRDVHVGYGRAGIEIPKLVHVQDASQAARETTPVYGVGTVPSFEPVTPTEKAARYALETILGNGKGVFLDMCYRPRITQSLELARKFGWTTSEGAQVVTWQLRAQWTLWASKVASESIDLESMAERVNQIVVELS